MLIFFEYDGHVLYLWWKSIRDVVTDELESDWQVSYREVWERRSHSEIVARRTEIGYKAYQADELAQSNEIQKVIVTLIGKSGEYPVRSHWLNSET